MVEIGFGKRQGLADIACIRLSQGVVPAFHVVGFARAFAHTPMRFFWKNKPISFPEITETVASAISGRNTLPELATGLLAPISDDKCDDLTRTSRHRCPKPALIGTLVNKGPNLIQLQDVVGSSGFEGLFDCWSVGDFFLTTRLRSGAPRRKHARCHAYWDVHNRR